MATERQDAAMIEKMLAMARCGGCPDTLEQCSALLGLVEC